MHVPNPLGGYPLVLRKSDVSNPRNGEVLYDYENNDLYYINKSTGTKALLAKEIYDKIIATRLGNTYIKAVKTSSEVESDVEVIPTVENRKMNTFYMNIYKRTESE